MRRASAPITLGALARHLGADLEGPEEYSIDGVATLHRATPDDLSFLANRHYLKDLASSRAGVVIVEERDKARCTRHCLVVKNPYLAYARAASLLFPPATSPGEIHPRAWIAPEARLHANVSIGANAVVEARSVLAAGVVVGPGSVIHAQVEVGENTRIGANVTLCSGTHIGCRGIIHPGAVIGADGFGLAHDGTRWIKVPQLGGVSIGDDVEIGANTAIDRGALEDTVIEDDVRIDNLVQIAHNVYIGAHTAIAGCAGIAGSTRIGKRCLIGGGVGMVGHITIADDVHITGGSNVLQSILEAGVYSSGTPLQPNRQWHRNYVRFKYLDEMAESLKKITS